MPDSGVARPRVVWVSFDRMGGWLSRYDAAHPGTVWRVTGTAMSAESPDGTTVQVVVPCPPLTGKTRDDLLAHLRRPWRMGIVLVRKGGFAVARVEGAAVAESKVGRRHVQSRTKAGGWSQQRFARRRDNQARAAFDAAAEHVHSILGGHATRLDLLGTGGDRTAVTSVLAHPELSGLGRVPHSWLGGFPDPDRQVLTAAVERVRSVQVAITDPPGL